MNSVTHTFGRSRITHEFPMYDDMACDVCSADARVDAAYWQGREDAAQKVAEICGPFAQVDVCQQLIAAARGRRKRSKGFRTVTKWSMTGW